MHDPEVKRFTFLGWPSKCLFLSGLLVKTGRTHLKLALAKEEGLWSWGLLVPLGLGFRLCPGNPSQLECSTALPSSHCLSSQEDPSCAQEQNWPQVGPCLPPTARAYTGEERSSLLRVPEVPGRILRDPSFLESYPCPHVGRRLVTTFTFRPVATTQEPCTRRERGFGEERVNVSLLSCTIAVLSFFVTASLANVPH